MIPVGACPVIGSSDVNVAVKSPVWTLKLRLTCTFSAVPSTFW